jgi:phosphatidate cytidylyltransferase
MADTFAYIFGTLYGKHKLYEKISPKKTIEGFIASYFGGLITAAIYNAIFIKFPIVDVFFSTLLIVSAGTTGDLVESMFKRQCHLKNSGTFFPGHGGILDRIDSLLFAIPVFYIYITYRFAQ